MKRVAIAFEVANGVDIHTLTQAVTKMVKGRDNDLSPAEYAAISSIKSMVPADISACTTSQPEAACV